MDLKILDINLWMLPRPFSADNKKRFSKFFRLVKRLRPDIITLQEVWLVKDEKFIRKSLAGYHTLSSGKKKINNSGLVTLSLKKPLSEKLHKFWRETLVDNVVRKGYLVISIKFANRLFHILNTHLHAARKSRPNKVTISQFEQLKEITLAGNWIISGDLNMTPEVFARLNQDHFRYKSCRSSTISNSNKYSKMRLNRFDHSEKRVDYLLLKTDKKNGFSIRTRVIKVPLLSDHYAIFSRINSGNKSKN